MPQEYTVGDSTYTVSPEELTGFLAAYPDAKPSGIDDIFNLLPAKEGERAFRYFMEDESDRGYSEFDVPSTQVDAFESAYPTAQYQPFVNTYDFDESVIYPEVYYKEARPGAIERVASRLIQHALPLPVKDNLPPAETTFEKGLDVAGSVPGVAFSFLYSGGIVGGVKTVTVKEGAKQGAKILNKAASLRKAGKVKQANKIVETGLKKGIFTATDKATGAGKSLVPYAHGLLGRSENYAKAIMGMAEKSPIAAKYLHTGVENFLTFGLHGQLKTHLPAWDLNERSKQFINDGLSSLLFTAAATPRMLEWSKLAEHTITPAGLFMIGAGSDKLSLFETEGAEEMDLTDRFINGLGLSVYYYANKGYDKFRIREKQVELLSTLGMPEKEARTFVKENSNIIDQAIQLAVKPRHIDIQSRWTDQTKRGMGNEVDLLRIERKDGKVARAVFQNLKTNKVENMPMKNFTKKFKRSESLGTEDIFGIDYARDKKTNQWKVYKRNIRGEQVGNAEIVGSEKKAIETSEGLSKKIDGNNKRHRQKQVIAKTKESNLGISDKDAKYIKSALYEKSKGSTTGMNIKELNEYNKMLTHTIPSSSIHRPNLTYLETADKKPLLGTLDIVKRQIVLDPVTYLRQLGKVSPTAKELSYTLEDFRDVFDAEVGRYSALLLRLKDMGFKPEQIDALMGEVDPKFKDYVTEDIKNHPNREGAIAEIKEVLSQTADLAVEYGLTVTSFRGGKKRVEPLWVALDSKGKPIILNEYKGIQNLKIGDSVKDIDGKNKKIYEIKYNHIEQDYIHHVLTEDARKAFNSNAPFRQYVIDRMVKSDFDAQAMRATGKELRDSARKTKSKKKREEILKELKLYSEPEIEKAMEKKFNELSGFIDEVGIYGNQYSRVQADIPPEIAFEKNGSIIKLDKFNTYKEGDNVGGKTIHKIIKTYETSMTDVLARYANKMGNVLAVAGTYGGGELSPAGEAKGIPGLKGKIAQNYVTSIARETGDEKLSKYVESILREQIHGYSVENELADLVIKTQRGVTAAVANAALSSPTSGLKNLMLGQTANITTFGLYNTGKALLNSTHHDKIIQLWGSEIPSKYKAMKHEAALIGALESGTKLLELQNYAKYNPGWMYLTELFNRTTAVSAGRFSAQTALDVLSGKETFFTKGMTKATARHVLFETFDLRNMAEIVERGTFTENELMKIEKRAHRVTQGAPSVEYMPPLFQRAMTRPLTLFHRMAYRTTHMMYNNVIVPAGKGNVWPLVKYTTAAYGIGKSREAIYYAMSGAPERDMMKPQEIQMWNTLMGGEYLQIFSNLFDERTGYMPAVIDYLQKTSNWMTYLAMAGREEFTGAEGLLDAKLDRYLEDQGVPEKKRQEIKDNVKSVHRRAAFDETVDWSSKSVNLLNQMKKVWSTRAEPFRAEADYAKKLQNIYADNTGNLSDYRAEKTYNPKSEFYEELQDLFWSGTSEEISRIYEASVMMLSHNLLHGNPGGENDRSAMDGAIESVEQKILSTSPTYFAGKVKGKRSASKYQTFLHALGEEDRNRVIAAQKDWEIRKRIWDDKVKDIRHQLKAFGFRKWYKKSTGEEDIMHEPTIYEPEYYEKGTEQELDVPIFIEGIEQE